MTKNENNVTRRNFLRESIWGTCLAGLGGPASLLASKTAFAKRFTYNLEDLTRIDPSLILYEESDEVVSTGFANLHGMAVDSKGAIYVAGDKAIRVFNESGELLREVKLNGTARCVTIADDGKIYIGMKDHVLVYNRQFKPAAVWQSLGDEAFFTSIAVSKKDVFVANAGNRMVVHYDTSGQIINHIGKKDKDRNIPGFVVPSPYFDLAVGPDGLLRVANPGRHRIEAYTFDGELEFWWGEFSNVNIKGFTGCCNPVNFAMLQDGSFITCEKGLVRVKRYDAEGAFTDVVAGPEQLVKDRTCRICNSPAKCGSGGFDVAVDTEGRIFVLDTIKNVVRIFTRVEKRQ